jgi:hypothetical protein
MSVSIPWRSHVPWRLHRTWRGYLSAVRQRLAGDDLAPFYRTGPGCMAIMAEMGPDAFPAIVDTVDETAFAAAAHTTHTMRYQDVSIALSAGDLIHIDGYAYKVICIPRRINTLERQAQLALQP